MKMGGGCNSGLRKMADYLSSCVQTSGLLLESEPLKWILKKRDYKHRMWTNLESCSLAGCGIKVSRFRFLVPRGYLIN